MRPLYVVTTAALLLVCVMGWANAMSARPDGALPGYKCVRTSEVTSKMSVIPPQDRHLWSEKPLCPADETPVMVMEGLPPEIPPDAKPVWPKPLSAWSESQPIMACPTPSPGYHYTSAQQQVSAVGVSGTFTVNEPYTSGVKHLDHSIAELAARFDSPAQNFVEMVIGVDAQKFNDYLPHLIVGYFRNGSPFYDIGTPGNANNFVSTNSGYQPGMVFGLGASHDMKIRYVGGNWALYLDGTEFGYFPGTIWNNQFTTAVRVDWFGEVYSAVTVPITAMGNGRFGTNPISGVVDTHAASITNLVITLGDGTTRNGVPQICETDANYYNIDSPSAGVLNFGGPGAAATAAYIAEFTASSPGWDSAGASTVTKIDTLDNNTSAVSLPFNGGGSPSNYATSFFSVGAVSPDGSNLFLNAGSVAGVNVGSPPPCCSLYVLGTAGNTYSGPVSIPSLSTSRNLVAAVSPDGNTVYAPAFQVGSTTSSSGAIYSITNTSGTWALGTTYNVDFQPCLVSISSDGKTLFVADEVSGSIFTIDVASGSTNQAAPDAVACRQNQGGQTGYVPGWQWQMLMRPDQGALYVAGAASITEVAIGNNAGVPTYSVSDVTPSVEGAIGTIAFAPDSSRLYVSAQNTTSSGSCSTAITVLDPTTDQLVVAPGLANPIALSTQLCGDGDSMIVPPVQLTISADGSALFVSLPCTAYTTDQSYWMNSCISDTVFKVDTATGAQIGGAITVARQSSDLNMQPISGGSRGSGWKSPTAANAVISPMSHSPTSGAR